MEHRWHQASGFLYFQGTVLSRLKLMKADHQSKQYRLEDQLLKYFPEEIEKHKGFIMGFESDLEVLAVHPHPEDGFAGMEIRGDLLTDKENAGAALLDACKEVKTPIRCRSAATGAMPYPWNFPLGNRSIRSY